MVATSSRVVMLLGFGALAPAAAVAADERPVAPPPKCLTTRAAEQAARDAEELQRAMDQARQQCEAIIRTVEQMSREMAAFEDERERFEHELNARRVQAGLPPQPVRPSEAAEYLRRAEELRRRYEKLFPLKRVQKG